MSFKLSIKQFFLSHTVQSIAVAIMAELASSWHPVNPEVAKTVSLLGMAAAMYFRMNPNQIPTAQNQMLIANAVQAAIRAGHPLGQTIAAMAPPVGRTGFMAQAMDAKSLTDDADRISSAIKKTFSEQPSIPVSSVDTLGMHKDHQSNIIKD